MDLIRIKFLSTFAENMEPIILLTSYNIMKHIKLFAVIVAMAICGTVSAQENFLKVSYSNVAIKASTGGFSFTENMNGL